MASTIRKRGKKGIWWYYGYFGGREYRFPLKTSDKRLAEREQRQHDARYTDPNFIVRDQKNPTLDEFWGLYLKWLQTHRSTETVRIQTYHWGLLKKFFKVNRMGEIRTEDVERFKTWRKENNAADVSVDNSLKDFAAMWNRAMRSDWYTGQNPFSTHKVERLTTNRALPQVTFHTKEDVQKLLSEAKKRGRQTEWVVLLGVYGGLRKNELLNLRWEALDFDEKEPKLIIPNKTIIKRPRIVPMSRKIFDALLPHRKQSGYVFENERPSNGIHRYHYDPKKSLDSALKAAGLDIDDAFQKMRRTFGSLHLQAGTSIFKVATWLGHSVKVCQRHYAALLTYDGEIDKI